MQTVSVGVLGSTSFIGDSLLPQLQQSYAVVPFTRRLAVVSRSGDGDAPRQIPYWISLMPIWALPDQFPTLEAFGARRIVALSSTSTFTKVASSDAMERALAARILDGEARLAAWASERGVEWLILRPTLIYGGGRDRNVCEIARFIRRFRFFPIVGSARGLRQPVRSSDVATACVCALEAKGLKNCSYNISGEEILTYRDMVVRIFQTLGGRPRLVPVPLWLFRLVLTGVRRLPRYREWSVAMVERMSQDLVFDNAAAKRDFGFSPSAFRLTAADLPP